MRTYLPVEAHEASADAAVVAAAQEPERLLAHGALVGLVIALPNWPAVLAGLVAREGDAVGVYIRARATMGGISQGGIDQLPRARGGWVLTWSRKQL